MAGIIEKFDTVNCHMEGNEYTKELEYDYPSLGQLRALRESSQTSLIFIGNDDGKRGEWFRKVSEFLQDTNMYDVLKRGTDFAEIISRQYKAIKGTLRVKVENEPEGVEIKFKNAEQCNPSEGFLSCKNVQIGKITHVTAEFEVQREFCFKRQNSEVTLLLDGFKDQTMTVELSCVDCQCVVDEENSAQCSNNGNLTTCRYCDCK